MAKQLMTARVVLKKCKTYKFQGVQWIKDVPRVIKGKDLIKQYQQNGFFHVKVLKDVVVEKPKKVKEKPVPLEKEVDEEKSSSGSKASKGKKLKKR